MCDSAAIFGTLDPKDADGFEMLFRIYKQSIPVREQKSRAPILEMARRSDYQVRVAREECRVIGFAITYVSSAESFRLLEYLAVDLSRRGGGVGAALFRDALGGIGTPLLLEVEAEEGARAEREQRRLRKKFYRRLGCRRIEECRYVLPLPGPGPAPAMELWTHLPEPWPSVPKATVKRWLRGIYVGVYGCAADDPRIEAMAEPLDDPVRFT